MQEFRNPKFTLRKFRKPKITLWKFRKGCEKFANQLCLAKTLRNLKEVANSVRNSKTHFATLPIPTVSMRNTNGQGEIKRSLKQAYLKTSKASIHFASPICSLRNPAPPCESAFSLVDVLWTSCGHPFEEVTSTSQPISAMMRIRGGHTDPSVSREARPRASSPQDSSKAPQVPPRSSRLLRVGCLLALLSADTRDGDHWLLHPLSHQYTTFHLREPRP